MSHLNSRFPMKFPNEHFFEFKKLEESLYYNKTISFDGVKKRGVKNEI